MALKNLYTDDRRDESITDAYYRIKKIRIQENTCTFTLQVWKSRAKFQNGVSPIEDNLELLTGTMFKAPASFPVDRNANNSIFKQAYDYIKTLPGWENATDAND